MYCKWCQRCVGIGNEATLAVYLFITSLIQVCNFNCIFTWCDGFGTALQVNITTDPPTPPYPAATWIRFRCGVVTSLPVSYNWTGYCTSQGSNQVAFTFTNYINTEGYTLNVRSTPTICIDTVVCSAADWVGNSGEATWEIANVTGRNWVASYPGHIFGG